mmetsp:Transcript_16425/g.40595  ORF Transcript_16425/g.40595 Transcript_16425/m.40595 type:complete len:354 (-) Transcript_16425:425-1486(-)
MARWKNTTEPGAGQPPQITLLRIDRRQTYFPQILKRSPFHKRVPPSFRAGEVSLEQRHRGHGGKERTSGSGQSRRAGRGRRHPGNDGQGGSDGRGSDREVGHRSLDAGLNERTQACGGGVLGGSLERGAVSGEAGLGRRGLRRRDHGGGGHRVVNGRSRGGQSARRVQRGRSLRHGEAGGASGPGDLGVPVFAQAGSLGRGLRRLGGVAQSDGREELLHSRTTQRRAVRLANLLVHGALERSLVSSCRRGGREGHGDSLRRRHGDGRVRSRTVAGSGSGCDVGGNRGHGRSGSGGGGCVTCVVRPQLTQQSGRVIIIHKLGADRRHERERKILHPRFWSPLRFLCDANLQSYL